MIRKRAVATAILLLLAGCTPGACLLTGQQRVLLITLYFGRDIDGRAPVSDQEWARFAAEVIGRHFPAGFTTYDAAGQWRDPAGIVGREPTKVVEIAVPASVNAAPDVAAVADAYKRQFHQIAVGVVSREACGAF